MKNILIIFILLLYSSIIFSQKITRSNLPFINLETLDEKAYEKGKLTVKVNRAIISDFNFSVNNGKVSSTNSILNKIIKTYNLKSIQAAFQIPNIDETKIELHQKYDLDLWFRIEFDENKNIKNFIKELNKTLLFTVVEPVYKKSLMGINFIPNDARYNEQWALKNTGQNNGIAGKDINIEPAWDIETGNKNVIVSVHDMGIQLDHPDLMQNVLPNKHFNFIYNKDSIIAGYHGTYVSGIVGAVNNNGIGISGVAGGNGNANSGISLMSCQVYDYTSSGWRSGGFGESFIYAADNGVAISNNSWAYDYEGTYELHVLDAIDYFIDNGGGNALKGGLVVFSAGNKSADAIVMPSAYERVIAVASTNNRDEKANYSTYGKWVDIAAPGGDFRDFHRTQVLSTGTNSGYRFDHGTSGAAPFVTGVVALIVSKGLGKFCATDVREILLNTTDNIDDINPNFIGFLGSGRLNAFKALQKTEQVLQNSISTSISNLTIENNCSQLSIKWNNPSNKKCVLVYSNVNDIGLPKNATQYNIGNTFNNTSKVIYIGNSNSFLLNNNDALLHFFKIFEVDANNNFSLGLSKEIVTSPSEKSNFDIAQNFDYPFMQPTQQWRTINKNKDIGWIHTVQDTANTGFNDLYSMCAYNYGFNRNLGSSSILMSPIFKTTFSDSLLLSFTYAYQYRQTAQSIVDTFEVLVTKDCGKTFTSLYKLFGQQLSTTATTTVDTAFYPFSNSFWKTVSFKLGSFVSTDKIQFAFRVVNGKGNNLFLDNINIEYINNLNKDASLSLIDLQKLSNCASFINPKIELKNIGRGVITSSKIVAKNNNKIVVTNWTGSLFQNQSTIIELNSISTFANKNDIQIYIESINNNADENHINDTISSSFEIASTTENIINESFENAGLYPSNWLKNQQPVDIISWIVVNGIGYNSNKSLVLANHLYESKNRVDDAITNAYVLNRKYDSVSLDFDYAYAVKKLTDNSFSDSLQIDYTKDCGVTWTNLFKREGINLLSFNQTKDKEYEEYKPIQNDWKHIKLLLSKNCNLNDAIQVRFRNITRNGNNVYLDNVNIKGYINPGILQTKGYAIYPNPSNGKFFIQYTQNNLIKIEVVNATGRLIKILENINNATNETLLNLNEISSGVYFLRLHFSDKVVVEKIVKVP